MSEGVICTLSMSRQMPLVLETTAATARLREALESTSVSVVSWRREAVGGNEGHPINACGRRRRCVPVNV
jgi:hypothetical protein